MTNKLILKNTVADVFMNSRIPSKIDKPKNQRVLKYLDPLSCHGDIVEPLSECLRQYGDVNSFCPDPPEFKFVAWYVGDTVFAFAEGMKNVSLRISDGVEADPIEAGGHWHNELEGWLSLPYNCSQLCEWAHIAYNQAKNSK